MSEDRSIFVIDTNILIDYVDIIPGEGAQALHEPTVDLSQAHLVIPTVVVRELSNFKGENTDRGKAARTALRRLRDLFENDIHSIEEVYNLQAPIAVGDGQQLISILPLHRDFWKCSPFHPSSNDMDGQIILTAMAVGMTLQGKNVDGTDPAGTVVDEERSDAPYVVFDVSFDEVTILTNDNCLAIRARERGLRTSRYGCKFPPPYTGRRDIRVPKELFADFINDPDGSGISREVFEELMPDELRLVANEFIVMEIPEAADWPRGYNPYEDPDYRYVGRYDVGQDAIVHLKYVRDFPTKIRNVGQVIYAEALTDPDIAAVICTGPAGSGKTYMSTIFGYKACQLGRFIGVTVVPCENRSNIGALPGDLDEKMDPDVQPMKNALRNYLLHDDPKLKKKLATLQKFKVDADGNGCDGDRQSLKVHLVDRVSQIWDNWFSSTPIESARGRDFAYELAIYDEFQDQNTVQADTLIKRIGNEGKIVLTGDIEQIHAPYLDRDTNGLVYASRQLFDNPMVAQVCFTEDEVVRHPLVKEIARRQKASEHKTGD